jgi:hypothetical protein
MPDHLKQVVEHLTSQAASIWKSMGQPADMSIDTMSLCFFGTNELRGYVFGTFEAIMQGPEWNDETKRWTSMCSLYLRLFEGIRESCSIAVDENKITALATSHLNRSLDSFNHQGFEKFRTMALISTAKWLFEGKPQPPPFVAGLHSSLFQVYQRSHSTLWSRVRAWLFGR